MIATASMHLAAIPFFLCWGSFLNVLGYRLVRGKNITISRSACPSCNTHIAWYDLIPIASWLFLCGTCRICTKPISMLYPFIEIFTAISLSAILYFVPLIYFPAYFLFFSALLVTIRSDAETMLISRAVTVWLIPVALILSATGMLPLSVITSMAGALLGYTVLYIIGYAYKRSTGVDGIGAGDLDLLAFIGAFTGPFGCWISLFLGSMAGSLAGLYTVAKGESIRTSKLPFGPFLALGAILFVLFKAQLLSLLLGM